MKVHIKHVLITSALWSSLFLLIFIVLTRFPTPPGSDGYFYLVQIKYLSLQQRFYYPDYSLAFLLPWFFSFITNSPLLQLQLSIACVWSSLILVLLLNLKKTLSQHAIKRQYIYCLFLAGLLITSLNLWTFSLTYYKNLTALLFFTLAVFYFQFKKKNIIISIILLTISLLCHKSMLLFIIIFSAVTFKHLINTGKVSKKIFFCFCGPLIIFITLFIFFFKKGFAYLLHLFSFFDSPASWFRSLISIGSLDKSFLFSILMTSISITVYFIKRKKFKAGHQVKNTVLVVITGITLFPVFTINFVSPVYRLLLLGAFLFNLLFIESMALFKQKRTVLLILTIITGAQIFLFTRQIHIIPKLFSQWNKLDTKVENIKSLVPKNSLIIAHHGLKFYITYKTGLKTSQYRRRKSDQAATLFRIAYVPNEILAEEQAKRLKKIRMLALDKEYILIREDQWQRFIKEVRLKKFWQNPQDFKPGYIY